MGNLIKMNKSKIWLIVGIVLVILSLLATFFITKQVYYDKGVEDQFVTMINGIVGIALECQPINIQLDQDRTIQLVNIACYQS